jgi:hypothetical protein
MPRLFFANGLHSTLHLYEIHTAPQLPLVIEGVLSGEHVAELARPRELARLRDFL